MGTHRSAGLVTGFFTEEVAAVQPVVASPAQTLDISVRSEVISASEAEAFIAKVAATGRTHLLSHGETWTWEQMRDYVVGQIESKWGVRPRDPAKESGIFKGFVNRWGDRAESIARAAFEVHNGMWRGAPIAAERFCAGSDPYFAQVIANTM